MLKPTACLHKFILSDLFNVYWNSAGRRVSSVNFSSVSYKSKRDLTPASRAMAANKPRCMTNAKRGAHRNSPSTLPEEASRRGQTIKGGGSATTPWAHQQRVHRENIFVKKLDPPYEEYWSKELVQQGLKRGELIQGVVRISPKNYEEAFIDDPEGGPDYYVSTMRSRNRALQNDVVVLQVLPRDQWIREDQAELLLSRGTDTADIDSNPTTVDQRMPRSTHPQSSDTAGLLSVKADVSDYPDRQEGDESKGEAMKVAQSQLHHLSLEGVSTSQNVSQTTTPEVPSVSASLSPSAYQLSSETAPLRETLIDRLYAVTPEGAGARRAKKNKETYLFRRTVKVVYIVETGHCRACAGYLKSFHQAMGVALFSPKDSKLPRVVLPLTDCPPDYCQNRSKYETTMFICRIQQWPLDSPFAYGTLMRSLGEAGEIEPETESFLLENEIDSGDFPSEALDCLPKSLPWTVPKEEERKRRDFRKECVFSIDPATARDLDDALHVKKLDKDLYEVGVHIADVSYFVEAGSPLDKVASQRATSVYLVQRVIPMLPRLLCEQLCSLNPDEERLTFSIVWKMTGKGEFVSEWMGRSLIRSCAKLSYDHAQQMIDHPYKEWEEDELPPIAGGFSCSQVSEAVNILNKLGNALRRQRQSKGTLRLDQPKLSFSLDNSTGMPNGCFVYKHKESNRLIEEFMLLANMAVARKIQEAFPDLSLLRRHPLPKQRAADLLAGRCAALGIQLDISSAATIQASLDQYRGRTEDKEATLMEKMILVVHCTKIMELARYFCTGATENESLHYALNVPCYTHFTSPIRRYADIIVHRQLAHALGEGPACTMTTDEVEAQADHCNKKKKAAKTVEELSGQLFFAVFLRECGQTTHKGMVMHVLDRAFDVLVLDFGVIKRVYCQRLLTLKSYQYTLQGKNKIPQLTLVWPNAGGSSQIKQELTVFTPVEVVLQGCDKTLQYDAMISPPTAANSSSKL